MIRDAMTGRLTKYECSRIIGVRAAQLSMGAPSVAEGVAPDNVLMVAAEELRLGVLDAIVRRPLPGGKHSDVHVRALHVPDDIDALLRRHAPAAAARKKKL